jgi:hypothetical protein
MELYVFDVVCAGKVQFFQNGEEMALVRAASEEEPKLHDQSYFIRTLTKVPGKPVPGLCSR